MAGLDAWPGGTLLPPGAPLFGGFSSAGFLPLPFLLLWKRAEFPLCIFSMYLPPVSCCPGHQTWKTLHGPPGVTIPIVTIPSVTIPSVTNSLRHNSSLWCTVAPCLCESTNPLHLVKPLRRCPLERPDRLRNTAATTTEACGAVAVVALAQWRWVVAMVADRPSDGRLAPASPSPPSPPPIVMTTGPTACTTGNLLTEAGASLGRQRQGL